MTLRSSMLGVTLALVACGGGGGVGSGSPASGFSVVSTAPPVHEVAASAATPCRIGYWGDSISALTAPYIDPRIAVTLHSVVGGTSAAALATFLQDPLAEPIQVIEYGTNDANAGSDLIEPETSMLQRTKALGRLAVLTGIPQEQTGALAVEQNYDLWQSQQEVPYANWPGVAYAGASDTMPDGVHPEAAYAQRLAAALSTTILQNCTPGS